MDRAKDKYEFEYINDIVREVSKHVACPIGLGSRELAVMSYLGKYDGFNGGVPVLAIRGDPGGGKTTVARRVYQSYAVKGSFDYCCFIDKVEGDLNEHGLLHLQVMLLSEIVGVDYTGFQNDNEAMAKIKPMLNEKKVLLVIEDVDDPKLLKAIVDLPTSLFSSASKVIIITAKDEQFLRDGGIQDIHGVEKFTLEEACKLLSVKAFYSEKFHPRFISIFEGVKTFTSGNPFLLSVIGSFFGGKSLEVCQTALCRYESLPKKDTKEILQISFNALEESQKTMLIAIANDFKNQDLAEVEYKLRSQSGVCPKEDIRVLLEKSLLKIDEYGQVTLHALTHNMVKDNIHSQNQLPEVRIIRMILFYIFNLDISPLIMKNHSLVVNFIHNG